MKQDTLYISDLDGTLMRGNETLSEYTVRTINDLVEQGLPFTYATARSIQSARPMISFFKRKGFKPSIIPGRSYLQTNFVVPNMGHLSATLIYFIQSLAAIKAWPRMYTDGQLNIDDVTTLIKYLLSGRD